MNESNNRKWGKLKVIIEIKEDSKDERIKRKEGRKEGWK